MKLKSMGLILGMWVATSAFASESDYFDGYRAGFRDGAAKCGGGHDDRPGGGVQARCVEKRSGYGSLFELHLSLVGTDEDVTVAVSDGLGTDDNYRYCDGSIQDLRSSFDRYLCAPVQRGRYGNSFDLVRVTVGSRWIRTEVMQNFDGQGTQYNRMNCREALSRLR